MFDTMGQVGNMKGHWQVDKPLAQSAHKLLLLGTQVSSTMGGGL